MPKPDQKHSSIFKKAFITTVAAIITILVIVILFISPLTKYLIEKYDVKYTGRQITLSWAYVNPFTGYVYFRDVKIYEENSDSIALAVKGLSGQFELLRMFSGHYEVSHLVLDHPKLMVIKNKEDFNFTSFLKHLAPAHPDTTNAPSSFNILQIKIKEGEFHYLQPSIPITYYIKGGNFESDGKLWDADSVQFKFDFLSGPGSGSMQGTFTANFKTLDYHYDVIVNKFDLSQLDQYLKPIANYGTFTASLDAELHSAGNFGNGEDVTAHGRMSVNDLHLGKNKKEDYAAFDKLSYVIDELSPKNKRYLFDSVLLSRPYFKYEQYDHLDNIETMFGANGANLQKATSGEEEFNLIIEVARYVKILARNFFNSYYKINNLTIYKGNLKYNDYSLSEKFSIALDPLYIAADSIDKNYDRVNITFKSAIKPYGNAAVNLSINPRDTGEFDMNYSFQKIPVSLFNPYLITYTSFPLDRGTIEFKGDWTVRKGKIQSTNHFVVIDPRVTKRIKKKDTKWIPMPLVMALIRDRGDVIDFEIPITGNLKNPRFHLRDVVFDVLKNIFVKPPTTPYRMEVRNTENEIEKSLTLKWAMRQNELQPHQEQFAQKMADFLVKNRDASIAVHPEEYALKEKEYILLFEAKKKYFLSTNKNQTTFTEKDSERVEKMSIRDSSFLRYLIRISKNSLVFTIQEKCSKIVDSSVVNSEYNLLTKERANAFLDCFKKKGVEGRVKIYADQNTIPFNGFSFYKIDYKGEMPEYLMEAYQKMNELNEKGPRKEFEADRKKTKAPIYDLKPH